jgi:hypothetical protein
MKKTTLFLLLVFGLTLSASAQKCGGCVRPKDNPQGCFYCAIDQLLGGCTCTVEGGQCPGYGEWCGACNGFPQCPADDKEICCPIQIKAAAAQSTDQSSVEPSWITKVDFSSVVNDLEHQGTPLQMTKLIGVMWKHWLTAESCGHMHGIMKVSPASTANYEVIANAHFLEVIIHLDGGEEESFVVRKSGAWRVAKNNLRIADGKATRPNTGSIHDQ